MSHVIVTGAAGGIGSALVDDLLGEGYRVSAIDRPGASLDSMAERAAVTPIAADVSDSATVEGAVRRSVEANGPPYGLVNVAGDNRMKPLPELTDDDWRYLVDVNLSSTFYLCRAVLPLMRDAGGGRVVNFASIFGMRGVDGDAAYAAAKAGVIGLTRALATEFAPAGVTVNAVSPVVVLTERVKRMSAEHLQGQLDRIPLGRFSETSDVTQTVLFLLGGGGAYYTGQTLSPNGGDLMP